MVMVSSIWIGVVAKVMATPGLAKYPVLGGRGVESSAAAPVFVPIPRANLLQPLWGNLTLRDYFLPGGNEVCLSFNTPNQTQVDNSTRHHQRHPWRGGHRWAVGSPPLSPKDSTNCILCWIIACLCWLDGHILSGTACSWHWGKAAKGGWGWHICRVVPV